MNKNMYWEIASSNHKGYVIITGASSGIGRSLAFEFAKNNYSLILISRRMKVLENLKEELSNKYKCSILIYNLDLRSQSEIKEFCSGLKNENIKVDILINNAGIGYCGEFLDISIEKNIDIVETNITGLIYLTHNIAKVMKENKQGTILNVASTGAYEPGPLINVYYASKAFVLSFSQALYEELKAYNVFVCVLCPGTTKSEFAHKSGKGELKKAMNSDLVAKIAYKGIIKRKRLIIPGFKNKSAIFFCKHLPRYFTGSMVKNIQRKAINIKNIKEEKDEITSEKN